MGALPRVCNVSVKIRLQEPLQSAGFGGLPHPLPPTSDAPVAVLLSPLWSNDVPGRLLLSWFIDGFIDPTAPSSRNSTIPPRSAQVTRSLPFGIYNAMVSSSLLFYRSALRKCRGGGRSSPNATVEELTDARIVDSPIMRHISKGAFIHFNVRISSGCYG
jgi:hypothetical protein